MVAYNCIYCYLPCHKRQQPRKIFQPQRVNKIMQHQEDQVDIVKQEGDQDQNPVEELDPETEEKRRRHKLLQTKKKSGIKLTDIETKEYDFLKFGPYIIYSDHYYG